MQLAVLRQAAHIQISMLPNAAARRHYSVWLSQLHSSEMCAPQVYRLRLHHSGQAQPFQSLAKTEWSDCDTLLSDTLLSWLGYSCLLLLHFKHTSDEAQLCTKPLLTLCFHTQRILTRTSSNQQTLSVRTRCGMPMHGQSAVHSKEVRDTDKQLTLQPQATLATTFCVLQSGST